MRARFGLVAVQVLLGLGFGFGVLPQARAEIGNFWQVTPTVYRGAQPEGSVDNPGDYEELRSHGIRTIINLRADETVAQEAEVAQMLGLRFINHPLSPGESPSEDVVNAALADLGDASLMPIFSH